MAEKKPRKPRRNFAEERARVVQFCKLAIEIYTPMCSEQLSEGSWHGRIEGYKDVLRQLGELQ